MFEELPVDDAGGYYEDPPTDIDDPLPPDWCEICGQRHAGLCHRVFF